MKKLENAWIFRFRHETRSTCLLFDTIFIEFAHLWKLFCYVTRSSPPPQTYLSAMFFSFQQMHKYFCFLVDLINFAIGKRESERVLFKRSRYCLNLWRLLLSNSSEKWYMTTAVFCGKKKIQKKKKIRFIDSANHTVAVPLQTTPIHRGNKTPPTPLNINSF